jgi:putative transport protein
MAYGVVGEALTKYPEMAAYLAVGLGYLIGRLKFRGVGLGVVTGFLLGGILIGNSFHVPVSDQAKSIVFLLFLFGIGYSVGPGFFQNLKGEGWRWAVLGVFSGAQTMIAGVAAVQEKPDSQVATLGYSYTVAFGHIFLTI